MFRLLFVAILRPMTHVKFKEANVVRQMFRAKLLALCVMIKKELGCLKIFVNFYQTTRSLHTPKGCNINSYCCHSFGFTYKTE
jgi:hypothetical protein